MWQKSNELSKLSPHHQENSRWFPLVGKHGLLLGPHFWITRQPHALLWQLYYSPLSESTHCVPSLHPTYCKSVKQQGKCRALQENSISSHRPAWLIAMETAARVKVIRRWCVIPMPRSEEWAASSAQRFYEVKKKLNLSIRLNSGASSAASNENKLDQNKSDWAPASKLEKLSRSGSKPTTCNRPLVHRCSRMYAKNLLLCLWFCRSASGSRKKRRYRCV